MVEVTDAETPGADQPDTVMFGVEHVIQLYSSFRPSSNVPKYVGIYQEWVRVRKSNGFSVTAANLYSHHFVQEWTM